MTEQSASKVCIVDDDPDTRALIRGELQGLNFPVVEFGTGTEALSGLQADPCALVILDVGLPDIDGFEVCRRLRAVQADVPIIFVTSRAEEIDRVSGFALGADDYVSKPFSPRELGFRVKALLRRSGSTLAPAIAHASAGESTEPPATHARGEVLQFGPLSVEPDKRRVSLHGKAIALTALEYDVLQFLATNPGRPFSRDQLMEQVWGIQSSQYGPTVTTLLNRLRRKIEPNVNQPAFILTVFGVGYRFVDPAVEEIIA